MMQAMIRSAADAGIEAVVTSEYSGKYPWLLSYGLGHTGRRPWIEKQLRNGRHVIGIDLGYWDRNRSMRITVDADHPWRLMRDMPGDRFRASGIKLKNTYDPNGHIVLIGMGVKSRLQFGFKDQEWEKETLGKIIVAHPGRKVFYKAKKPEKFICKQIHGDISQALEGSALVVCRHSNVAIDAAIHGVPCVCEDGAGRALYSDNIAKPRNPTESERLQFLNNVAYWQYRPDEALQAWEFIKKVLN